MILSFSRYEIVKHIPRLVLNNNHPLLLQKPSILKLLYISCSNFVLSHKIVYFVLKLCFVMFLNETNFIFYLFAIIAY